MNTEAAIQSITLVRQKPNPFDIIGRMISAALGIFGVIVSMVMFVTVFLIPVAIFMFIGSSAFLAAAVGRQKATCPRCGHHRNYVTKRALNFKCAKCKTLTIIDWEK